MKSNKQGGAYIGAAVAVLILAMIISIIYIYASALTTANTTKANIQRALDSFIMHNAIIIYDNIKNGNNDMTDFDRDYFLDLIEEELNLDKKGNDLYSIGENGDIIFKMTNLNNTFLVDDSLTIKLNYTIYVPVKFAGARVFDIQIPVKVSSGYVPKT